METLSQIRQQAVEEMSENESLTADLDDEAAKILLEWGSALIDQVVVETHLDKIEFYLNAVGQLLRLVNRCAAHGVLVDGVLNQSWLDNFNQQLQILYDGTIKPVNSMSLQVLLSEGGQDNVNETIAALRKYVEQQKARG